MYFLTPSWIVAFVFAYCWYMGGKIEAKHGDRPNHGLFWALISIAMSALVIEVWHRGVFLVIVGQLVVFIGITLWRMKFEK